MGFKSSSVCFLIYWCINARFFQVEASNFPSPNEDYDYQCMTDKRDISLNRSCATNYFRGVTTFEFCKQVCCATSGCDFVKYSRNNCLFGSYKNLKKCQGAFFNQRKPHGKVAMKMNKMTPEYATMLSMEYSSCDGESNRFYCDDKKTCVAKHKLCDGISDCNDQTDEENCDLPVCTDRRGHTVNIGDTYQPMNRNDDCIFCVCSRNRSLQTCMSPSCSPSHKCADDSSAQCCICMSGIPVDYHRRLHLNGTQQMVVTGLLIILIVTIIVIFSRQIFRRHVCPIYHQLSFNRRRNMPDGITRGSFTPINTPELFIDSCAMSLRSNRQIPVEATIPPPSYSDLYKCTCDSSESCTCPCASAPLTEAPPSYPGSQCSLALSLNEESSNDTHEDDGEEERTSTDADEVQQLDATRSEEEATSSAQVTSQ